MYIVYLFVLFVCILAVAHTYVLYPRYVLRSAKRAGPRVRGKDAEARFSDGTTAPDLRSGTCPTGGPEPKKPLPPVRVLMAVHNEECVLPAKLVSLAAQDYPGDLRFYIGSDNSTDATDRILTDFAAADARLSPTLFDARRGKPGIINRLAERAGGTGIFVITDASVLLRPDVITELVRPFVADERIGVVDAAMVQTGARAAGIGRQEREYIHREVAVKRAESRLWGAMIGPFGGCWAIRAEAYRPVPANFLVDDFFLCMAAYEAGYRGVSSPTAVVEERVGQSISSEFRRKVRISGGNWQNLVRFRHLWWPLWRSPLAFAFFSHKVLRWWTPFFLLGGGLAVAGIAATSPYPGNYWAGLLLMFSVLGTAAVLLLDYLLAAAGVHFGPARYLRYFLAMNAALLVGFYRYLTGITSNVWQPSPRS